MIMESGMEIYKKSQRQAQSKTDLTKSPSYLVSTSIANLFTDHRY